MCRFTPFFILLFKKKNKSAEIVMGCGTSNRAGGNIQTPSSLTSPPPAAHEFISTPRSRLCCPHEFSSPLLEKDSDETVALPASGQETFLEEFLMQSHSQIKLRKRIRSLSGES